MGRHMIKGSNGVVDRAKSTVRGVTTELKLPGDAISRSERRTDAVTDSPLRATLSGRVTVVPTGMPSPTSIATAVVIVEAPSSAGAMTVIVEWPSELALIVTVTALSPSTLVSASATSVSDETAVTGVTVTGMDWIAARPLGSRTTTMTTAVPGPTGRIVSTLSESLTLATVLSSEAAAYSNESPSGSTK